MSHELNQLAPAFTYSSPSNVSHVINHGLGTLNPDVVVIDDATGQYILPSQILVVDANNVQIDLFVARAIRGRIE